MKRLFSGIAIGAIMAPGARTVSAQNERDMHPRLAAAQDQLGLCLAPREYTIDVLVIDHANKLPEDN